MAGKTMNKTTIDSDRNVDDLNRDIQNPEHDANPDAITSAPGSHPLGVGVGAAAMGAAGAAIGTVVPGVGNVVGAAIGAVVGAVAGGYAGKAVAEAIDPTDEDAYWRVEHKQRPYYDATQDYDRDYAPAYRTAVDTYNTGLEADYSDVEPELRNRWNRDRGDSKLDWNTANKAMRDVYERDRNSSDTKSTDSSKSSTSSKV